MQKCSPKEYYDRRDVWWLRGANRALKTKKLELCYAAARRNVFKLESGPRRGKLWRSWPGIEDHARL